MRKYVLAIFALALLLACKKEPETGPSTPAPVAKCNTGGAVGVTHEAAVINGWLSSEDEKTDLSGLAGFSYSKTKGTSEEIDSNGEHVDAGATTAQGGRFKASLEGLEASTTYYYIARAKIGEDVFLGEVRAFTTLEPPKKLCYTDSTLYVNEFAVELAGRAYPKTDTLMYILGFRLYEDSELKEYRDSTCDSYNKENVFTHVFKGLDPGKEYKYTAYVKSYMEGTDTISFFGDTLSFTTLPLPADDSGAVKTVPATDITEFRASLHGTVDIKTRAATEKTAWFLFGKEGAEPDSLSAVIAKDGSFDIDVSGLEYGVSYSFTACAKLEYNIERRVDPFHYEKTYRGETLSFNTAMITPVIKTVEATEITEFKGTLNGSLEKGSIEEVSTEVWFLWGTSPDALDRKVPVSLRDGKFQTRLGDLDYNTPYWYQACAKVFDQEVYGEVLSFTTLDITATVTTKEATDITEFTATLHGLLSDVSNMDFGQTAWFLYGPAGSDAEWLKENGTRLASTVQGDGSFASELAGLHYGTEYTYIACAMVYDKAFYGEVSSFTTIPVAADVTTGDATSVTEFQATLNGTLVDNSGEFPKTIHFWYGAADTVDELVATGEKVLVTWLGDGAFKATVTGLVPGTVYNYVACLSVYDTRFFGEVHQFTTVAAETGLSAVTVTGISQFGATLSCALTDTDIDKIGRAVDYYYTDAPLTSAEIRAAGKRVRASCKEGPVYEAALEGLSEDKQYYFTACLSYRGMEFLGDVNTFTTLDITELLVNGDASDITETSATVTCSVTGENPDQYRNSVYFYYGTDNTVELLMTAGKKAVASYSAGVFTARLTGLTYGTDYYYVPVMVSGSVEYPAVVKNFRSAEISATVVTEEVTSLKYHTVRLEGRVASISNASLGVKAWFLWSADAVTWNNAPAELDITAGTFHADVSGLDAATAYTVVACVSVKDVEFRGAERVFTTKSVPAGMVDLGLSVCWASMNVGAAAASEAGTFYLWEDACALGVRLPTVKELEEIRLYCNWTWTNLDGVDGYLVSGKTTAGSIFLPAAGAVYYGNPREGDSGIWSSEGRTRSDGIPGAYYLKFSRSQISVSDVSAVSYMFPVRTVAE